MNKQKVSKKAKSKPELYTVLCAFINCRTVKLLT